MAANTTVTGDGSDTLRVVLFGLPDAGKTSLLGALGQSAATQADLLAGQISDADQQLAARAREAYGQSAGRTAREIMPHALHYQPREGESVHAVLFDCDGAAANQLLASRQAPAVESPPGTLAGEIAQASALILVLDAAAPTAKVEKEFAEFGRFLRHFQTDRGRRTEVAGLPVFLVLSKCDLLAKPTDSMADWVERIEERKRDVERRFRKSISEGPAGSPAFGRIDLHVWDTAIRRPALKSTPARPREPYHVAELFRQVFQVAGEYHGRHATSSQRLRWTAAGAIGIVLTLVATAAGLIATSGMPDELQRRAEDLLLLDRPTAVERLRGPETALRERLGEFTEVRTAPRFESLPGKTRGLIRDRHDELTEYLAYFDRLRKAPAPADEIRLETIEELRRLLAGEAKLPREDWSETDAGRLYHDRLEEADALLAAARRLVDAFQERATEARELAFFTRHRGSAPGTGIDWRSWADDADLLLDRARELPFRETEPLPGASSLSYGTVYRVDRVVEARVDWEARRKQLLRVRDLCTAVGLLAATPERPALLLVPRRGFTLASADERARALPSAYPAFKTEFTRTDLPEALLPELTRAARTSYENLLEPGRAAVLQRLRGAGAGTEETVARWQPVRAWLEDPQELTGWRLLANTLLRLIDPGAADPVAAFAAFLDRTEFTLRIAAATLEIPDDLDVRPAIGVALVITHPRTRAAGPALTLAMDGEGKRDTAERLWRYDFTARASEDLVFHPGDPFSATLPLREDWMLVWDRARSALYRFECLRRAPALQQAGMDRAEAKTADRIRLTLRPADGVPAVPDLLPEVTLP